MKSRGKIHTLPSPPKRMMSSPPLSPSGLATIFVAVEGAKFQESHLIIDTGRRDDRTGCDIGLGRKM